MNNPLETATIGFYGGVGSVTGANFLLTLPEVSLLIDCGVFQGGEQAEAHNADAFPYVVETIDALLVTHAHMDHIGRIPKLVAAGFRGPIYSTPETMAIAPIMFDDAVHIMEEHARHDGRTPLFKRDDIEKTMALWHGVPYHTPTSLKHGAATFTFKDAGHILGSAMIEVRCQETNIVFTGDMGNSPAPFLRDTERITDADYVVMESVYGDRNHESPEERQHMLRDILKGVIAKKKLLLIPSFSLERAQTLLSEINDLVERGEVPRVPVFLDSPLAIRLMDIYRGATALFNADTQRRIARGDDIFSFPGLHITRSKEDSLNIGKTPNPKVVIAGSGMSVGGRILFHEQRFLTDPDTTFLIVGYQAAGTVGRMLADGAKDITIEGHRVRVRAHVETMYSYSSHKDRDHLIEFVAHAAPALKKVFVTMGEDQSALFLVQRLRDYCGVDASAPQSGDVLTISLDGARA